MGSELLDEAVGCSGRAGARFAPATDDVSSGPEAAGRVGGRLVEGTRGGVMGASRKVRVGYLVFSAHDAEH